MKKTRGFTIVEIALVLGIAGLIMVMAFVALPSLWSSQRDADRRANVMNFISALKTFQTNNSRGALPSVTGVQNYSTEKKAPGSYDKNGWEGLIQDYYIKGSTLEDPGGEVYTILIYGNCGSGVVGTKCDTTADGDITEDDPETPDVNEYKIDPKFGSPLFSEINKESPDFDIGNPTIYVVKGATCDEDQNAIVKAANPRTFAVVQVLEKGKYCQNT